MSCPTLGDAYAANWAQRVVNNGGARPAQATIDAAGVFYNSVEAAGLHAKMISVSFIAPDSLISAQTPFFVKSGNDPWTYSFLPADWDLTVNGIRATNLTRGMIIETTNARDMVAAGGGGKFDCGMTLYVPENVNEASKLGLGAYIVAGGFMTLQEGFTNVYQWAVPDGVGAAVTWTPGVLLHGYFSGNRTDGTTSRLYFANSTTAHSKVAENLTGPSLQDIPAVLLSACGGRADGLYAASTSKRYSFFAVHRGLIESESLAFFNAIQALRVALGGGSV